jgi:hypothetical protein
LRLGWVQMACLFTVTYCFDSHALQKIIEVSSDTSAFSAWPQPDARR